MTQELNFVLFKTAVQKQLATMTAASGTLFTVNLNKDALWQKYLDSFPAGTNPIYKEQRESEVPDFVAMAVSGNPAAITSSSRSETDLKMEIVMHIIKTKAAEQEQKEAQAKKAEQRRAIHELLAAKQTEELSQKSSEELLKMLEEL